MEKKKIGCLIIGSAIIWGAVMIGTALVLKGTPYKETITRIIWGGTMFHFLFIWAPIGIASQKSKKKKKEVDV